MKTPKCPWPESIWTMTTDEYVAAVPDERLRTSISGMLMRKGWEIAMEDYQATVRDVLTYARHAPGCATQMPWDGEDPMQCDCGLAELLAD